MIKNKTSLNNEITKNKQKNTTNSNIPEISDNKINKLSAEKKKAKLVFMKIQITS